MTASMALEEYQRKRRFEATPEPPPKVEKRAGHRFVVQKHRATRLHYDFRLELDGVLKSWAVPKGPSLDPADKRLSMHVEDHPVSYFDFEGIIPEGNYGSGTVMVWDVGTWQPLSPKPVNGKYVPGTDAEAREMLEKGDLKFRLSSKRLKGDFALVRIRSRRPGSKGTEWLLIKKHDDYAVPGFDINQYDTSVLTGRTMAQIGGDQESDQWKSSRPASRGRLKAPWLAEALAKAEKKKLAAESAQTAKKKVPRPAVVKSKKKPANPPEEVEEPASASSALSAVSSPKGAVAKSMPSVVHPMLAVPIEEPFDSDEWLFEIKWDGIRSLAIVEDGVTRLVSRSGRSISAEYPEFQRLNKNVRARQAVLDGEIVVLDAKGRSSFQRLQARFGVENPSAKLQSESPVTYYFFDVLYCDGYDLRRAPLIERKQLLASLLVTNDKIRISEHQTGNGLELFNVAIENGLEGLVAKRLDSSYPEGRTSNWLKFKSVKEVDGVIGGWTDPRGARQYFGSLLIGLYNDSKLQFIGELARDSQTSWNANCLINSRK